MYFLWAKINIASYGHTMFSLKLLILLAIRQCIMACFRTKWWWGLGGVGSATPPGTILLGFYDNINMPYVMGNYQHSFNFTEQVDKEALRPISWQLYYSLKVHI